MSGKLVIMAGLAVVFGATSYYAGNRYLDGQTQAHLNALENSRANDKSINLTTIVVAKAQLKFGQQLTKEMLEVVDWPESAMPEGSFTTVKELISEPPRRAIKTMEPGEPVLAVKLTGENGRAGLAGIIGEGMRAVTIPVDMVNGVGGFVQPGDRVDIILTKESTQGKGKDREEETIAEIIMENVKVLSVDQEADTRSSTAKVAKSVTLESDARGAQKLALANNIGRLSLLLRSAGDEAAGNSSKLSSSNLDGTDDTGGLLSLFKAKEKTVTSVRVVAGEDITSVTVPIEKQPKTDGKDVN